MSKLDSAPETSAGANSVSVVIVNYRGADDTIECITHLRALNYPAASLQIVVVDNDSGDDSVTRIREAAPDITLIESDRNSGFAGGCNLGVAHASGDFVAFINSDARPDPNWLRAAVAEFDASPEVAAVGSKVLDWDGKLIDYVGGNVNFIGQGYKLEAGHPDDGQYEKPKDVLFPTGSAAIFRANVFRELGGFDERFFMFLEDVDLGWRVNLAGHRVRYVPTSVVYHRHHVAIEKFGSYREHYLLARNSLLMIYKNFSNETLARVLAPALLLTVHGGVLLGQADADVLDLERSPGGDEVATLEVDKLAMTGAYAVDFLIRNLAEVERSRQEVQSRRVRSDGAMARLFGDLLQSTSPAPGYHRVWLEAVKVFGLDQAIVRQTRVLVITADTLSSRMAGPAIRAFHIADVLSRENDVKLVSTQTCSITSTAFECRRCTDTELRALVDWSDVVVFQGFVMHEATWLVESGKVIVVDIYDPMHLEQLEQGRAEELSRRSANITATTRVLNQQLHRGDFFLCASEEQRHFWLGQLAGLGRVNPSNYERDSSLRSLLAVAPFGLPSQPPERSRAAIKGVVPGIGPDDKVIIWGGGVYNWFDPLTLIHALDIVRKEHEDVRLFFLGMKHPNPNVPEMRMAWDARQLSDELGLTDTYVFFNEGWVDYDDRQNYLLDGDVGVSTHFEHVETTFSFRTRMLDYLWAGLPIVATGGDVFGRLIASEGLGIAVGERDAAELASALERAMYDEEFIATCKKNIHRVRKQFEWENALEPLLAFCRDPQRAPDADRIDREDVGVIHISARARHRPVGRVARNVRYAKQRYNEGGLTFVITQGIEKTKRLVRAVRHSRV